VTRAELLERYAAGERDFCGADLCYVNLYGADLRGAELRRADLRDADLRRADLHGADLRYADLSRADLCRADLRDADLRRADLHGAKLTGAKLTGADLNWADLRYADLYGADLRRAKLSGADLRNADPHWAELRRAKLRDADLRGADLRGADLRDADLSGTCLDPDAPLPAISDEEITAAGLEIRGVYVWGYRTTRSLHCGSQWYTPRPEPYVAPWFSVDTTTECHPGIYLDSREGILRHLAHYNLPLNTPLVRAYCRRDELVNASKWRAKRVWIPAWGQEVPWEEVQP
jgi:uncharacterized protein YjbI with pentapeptide repeats